MTLHVRIDRLVLEGTALSARDGARLEAVLGPALADLLRDRGLHPALAGGLAVPTLPGPAMALPAAPAPLGRQLALALADTLGAEARP
jgi:hypothetical protein